MAEDQSRADASRQDDTLLRVVASSKRKTVSAACERCRQHKIKCDAERPCGQCSRRGENCRYSTQPNEVLNTTEHYAKRRKYENAKREAADLREIYNAIATQDETTSRMLFQHIRQGKTPAQLLQTLRSDPAADNALYSSMVDRLRIMFLFTLVRSDADLHDAAALITEVLNIQPSSLPSVIAYRPLRDVVVTAPRLTRLIAEARNRQEQQARQSRQDQHESVRERIGDGFYHGPPIWVPAHPWTDFALDDKDMSYMISFFFAFINPYLRDVEEDVFVEDMRSCDLRSQFCSKFLVHAILASTMLRCEHEKAFTHEARLATRGEHFHQEALRLWELEYGRATASNVQALLVMSISCTWRGQDTLASSCIANAISLCAHLCSQSTNTDPMHTWMAQSIDSIYIRIMQRIATTVDFHQIGWKLSYKQAAYISFPELHDSQHLAINFPDNTLSYRPFPFSERSCTINYNLLARYRSGLSMLVYEINKVYLQGRDKTDVPSLITTTLKLSDDLDKWYNTFDTDFPLGRAVPAAIYEISSHYACAQLQLYDLLQNELDGVWSDPIQVHGIESSSNAEHAMDLHARALSYADLTAVIIRAYRVSYGLKVVSVFQVHAASLACFRSLQGMDPDNDTKVKRQSDAGQERRSSVLENATAAFEECLRCLLASAVENMFARPIVKAVLNTAQRTGVVLSEDVHVLHSACMSTIMVDEGAASLYPNFALRSKRLLTVKASA